MGLWTRVRQNLSLKIISLVAAILLYIFVQQERNPTISKMVLVNVDYIHVPPGYQVIPASQRYPITVSGPRPNVDRLMDYDVRAIADLTGTTGSESNTPIRVRYEKPKGNSDISLDAAPDLIKIQVFRERTRKLEVQAKWDLKPPPGYGYGEPTVRPSQVTVRGREDVVNRISKIVAFASPEEPMGNIDGDFTLQARDSDQNVISGVDIVPEKVHVTVPEILLPAEQYVRIQTPPPDPPAPPYTLVETRYQPNSVKIIGSPQRVAEIHTISTESLSIRDLTQTTTLDAVLIIPPDVQVRDLKGKPISRVKVTFIIAKAKPDKVTVPDGPAPPVPKHDGAQNP